MILHERAERPTAVLPGALIPARAVRPTARSQSRMSIGSILRTGWVQSFVGHAIAFVALGMIGPHVDEAMGPIKLVLALPTEVEEPVVAGATFVIEPPPPAMAESAVELVPIQQPPVALLPVDGVWNEPAAGLAPMEAWADLPGDALWNELTPGGGDARALPGITGRAARAGAIPGGGEASPPRGAIGGELGRRLQAAGAQTGDVQVSIRWDGVNDIDLHVMVEPFGGVGGSLVCWQQRIGRCGGMLDVDANAHPAWLNPKPVENVFWPSGRAPFGRYTIAVHHYMPWSRIPRTPVEVAVLVDGEVSTFQVVATYGEPARVVTSFIRQLPEAAGQLAAADQRDPKE